MKIERMNDQQIRCTLTGEDLAARHIKLSELAYGTEKARSLFSEMMAQASDELDFNAEDTPLMIEAVPLSSDSLVLTVTKVDDPEELDTRFAQFSPSLISDEATDEESDIYEDILGGPDSELSQLFKQLSERSVLSPEAKEDIPLPQEAQLVRLFSFDSMDALFRISRIVSSEFKGESALYKRTSDNKYLLYIEQGDTDLITFNRICSSMTEYGHSEKHMNATIAYLDEHHDHIIPTDAIQSLASI